MEAAMARLRVWPIWKELRHFAVTAVCEDCSTSARADAFCQTLSRYLSPNCKISKGSWLLSELTPLQLRSVAAGEAAQADLVIISIHHAESLPKGMENWIDLWLGQKGNRPTVMLALFDSLHLGSSTSIRTHLEGLAKTENMEFLAQSEEAPEDG